MNRNSPEQRIQGREINTNEHRSSSSERKFNTERDAKLGNPSPIPDKGPLRKAADFASSLFRKEVPKLTREEKSVYIKQRIEKLISEYRLDTKDLLKLREENLDIHREDIVKALSTHIESQLKDLREQSPATPGSSGERFINMHSEIYQTAKKNASTEIKDKEGKVIKTTTKLDRNLALESMVQTANALYKEESILGLHGELIPPRYND